MTDKRYIIAIAGLVATMAGTAYMVVQLHAQTRSSGDFSAAAVAEVQDARGQAILRGQFVIEEDDDDDIEREARLTPTGSDSDARGDAEVEIARADARLQEIEFSVSNLAPGTQLTFIIDGQAIGQATVDRAGRAKLRLSGSPAVQ